MNAGQIAILDAWLAQYEPTDSFDTNLDHVLTTENIISELSDMADWDVNEVAEHIATAGFRFKPDCLECNHGWILRVKH